MAAMTMSQHDNRTRLPCAERAMLYCIGGCDVKGSAAERLGPERWNIAFRTLDVLRTARTKLHTEFFEQPSSGGVLGRAGGLIRRCRLGERSDLTGERVK